jgi:hypothetical protein
MRFLIIFLLFVNAVLLGQLLGWLPTLFEDSADSSRAQAQVAPEMARVIALEAPPPPVPLGTPLSGPNAPASVDPAGIALPANPTAAVSPPSANPNQTSAVVAPLVVPPVIAPGATGNAAVLPTPPVVVAAAPPPAAKNACLEVGPVASSTAQVLQANLLSGTLVVPSQLFKPDGRPDDQTSYMVILEGATNQKEAQAREQQARSLGARDAFIVPDGPNQFAVSLGIFKVPEAANSVVTALTAKGLIGMRVVSRPGPGKWIIKIPNIAPEKVDGVRAVLSGQAVKACTA